MIHISYFWAVPLGILAFASLVMLLWVVLDSIRFAGKNNCLFWAVPRWLVRAIQGQEAYLVLRLSFIRWGFLHCLLGRYDHSTGQVALSSYKPPPGHRKTRFAPTFIGKVVHGDTPTRHGDLT